jgi:hypothetical protein
LGDRAGNQLITDAITGCFGGYTVEASDWDALATAVHVAEIAKFTAGRRGRPTSMRPASARSTRRARLN